MRRGSERLRRLIATSALLMVQAAADAPATGQTGQSGDTVVDCEQENSFDSGANCNWKEAIRCCCWCPDPTGAHAWGHVMDLGRVVSNVDVELAIRPGAGDAGCTTAGYMYYSDDGSRWSLLWSEDGLAGWTTYSDRAHISTSVRYIRANTDSCSVDWSAVRVGPATPCANCVGDCNGDCTVTIDEILTLVRIALGKAPLSDCQSGDASGDGEITVDEIVRAVRNALNGCG